MKIYYILYIIYIFYIFYGKLIYGKINIRWRVLLHFLFQHKNESFSIQLINFRKCNLSDEFKHRTQWAWHVEDEQDKLFPSCELFMIEVKIELFYNLHRKLIKSNSTIKYFFLYLTNICYTKYLLLRIPNKDLYL